ncbi:nuclear transport factor 2 family protein [Novosphingobium sp. BL-52-GroH]|uniref:nuclear transport factor 2 family protein n=1 Tax=Novosphingobium sp. BL-52-GroH TaxID=3349877 RepID=UPI00384BF2AC
MAIDEAAFQALVDKDAIRELVLLYSRAIDRQDTALLRDLYTPDATDTHGDSFDGPADAYCAFIESAFPHMPYSGHHVCNHLVAVDGDDASGEVYALAFHLIPTRDGGREEDFMAVRYIDNYRRCADGRWRFAKRVVTYDFRLRRPFDGGGLRGLGERDPSYAVCTDRLFARGART